MTKMLAALSVLLAAVLCLDAAAQSTREFDEVWGKGFLKPEQFVEVVYSSLAPRRK